MRANTVMPLARTAASSRSIVSFGPWLLCFDVSPSIVMAVSKWRPLCSLDRLRRRPDLSGVMPLDVPPGYRILKEDDVAAYLANVPAVAAELGGSAVDWKIREVGDGNLNLVFVVEGPRSGVVVKQALPYVRLVGESWPLSLTRSYFEQQ